MAPPKTSVVTCYDQKTSELHDYLHHDYFHVSVGKFPGKINIGTTKTTPGVLVVLVVLVVLEVPGPEIRILPEISSPELAGKRRKTKKIGKSDVQKFSGNFLGSFSNFWPLDGRTLNF